jgi:hypothetical protein
MRPRLRAELLSIRLRVALGRLDRTAAINRLEAMSAASDEAGEQTAVWETTWRVDPDADALLRKVDEAASELERTAPGRR